MGESVDLERVSDRLVPVFADAGVDVALLFGSAATDHFRKDRSDLDFAVAANGPVDTIALNAGIVAALKENAVDVVDLRRAPPLLAMEAVRTGKLLFERNPGDYSQLASLVFRRYVDTAKLRRAQQDAIRMFLIERGLA